MNASTRRVLPLLLLWLLLRPPAACGDVPQPAPLRDDKLVHFLAGLALGLSAGGAFTALAPRADCRDLPLGAGGIGLAAGLLAGAGKEVLDARRGPPARVEAADLLHTLLGGLAGGVLAEAWVRSGQAAGLQPRWVGIGLALGGGSAVWGILRSAPVRTPP